MKNFGRMIICLASFTFCSGAIIAQEVNLKHSIGLQLNPYLDSHLFNGTFIRPVFAVRYSWNLNNHLSFGPEVSGNYTKMTYSQNDYFSSVLNIGGYGRYSFLAESRIKPFFEISPYYTFYHFKSNSIVTQEGTGKEVNDNYFSGYISPGVTLLTKSKRISLDLMYKISNKDFINGQKAVFSYRLNFNF